MPRNLQNISHIKVDNLVFARVEEFKYLRENFNHRNNMHSEVRQRMATANGALFVMNKMLSSKMLFWITKETINTCYVRSVIMYACKTWSTTESDKNQLLSFKRRVLRKIYGSTRNSNTGKYKKRKNTEYQKNYIINQA